jgi:hypothetical protein
MQTKKRHCAAGSKTRALASPADMQIIVNIRGALKGAFIPLYPARLFLRSAGDAYPRNHRIVSGAGRRSLSDALRRNPESRRRPRRRPRRRRGGTL